MTFPPWVLTDEQEAMMTLRTGHKNAKSAIRHLGGFTLIELVLVMALLIVVLGVAGPSLSGFFKGRNLGLEARRFISLTRYAQSRAVAEGWPMVLWIAPQQRRYGLRIQPGWTTEDAKAVDMELDDSLQIEVQRTIASPRLTRPEPTVPGLGNVPMILFLPTGFISETSPELIVLRQGIEDEIWIAPSANRLTYEIQTNALRTPRR